MPRKHVARVTTLCVSLVCLVASIHAQQLKTVGTEVQVNTFEAGAQRLPAVAKDADGDFVVVWASNGQDGNNYGIFGRLLDSSGNAVGPEFMVNTFTTGSQRVSSVAAEANGAFVVVWSSNGQDGANYGIFGRRFDAAGGALGPEFQVTISTLSSQAGPFVAANPAGGFIASWHGENNQDGNLQGVFARRFNAAGSPLGGEIQVNAFTTGNQFRSSIAVEDDGDFVMAWQSYAQDGSSNGVFARRFTSAGVAKAGEQQVNTYTMGDQRVAFIDGDADGDFVVSWSSEDQDGSGSGVWARRFNSSGTALATEFRVNTYTSGDQFLAQVEVDPAGSFVLAWHSFDQDGSDNGIFAKRYTSTGAPISTEFQANTYIINDQQYAAIGADEDGDFVIVWESEGQDGSDKGIFAQSYSTHAVFDIDGNGEVTALTDGVLALRYMFGFTGTTLTLGAVDTNGCTRCDGTAIAAYMQGLV